MARGGEKGCSNCNFTLKYKNMGVNGFNYVISLSVRLYWEITSSTGSPPFPSGTLKIIISHALVSSCQSVHRCLQGPNFK